MFVSIGSRYILQLLFGKYSATMSSEVLLAFFFLLVTITMVVGILLVPGIGVCGRLIMG